MGDTKTCRTCGKTKPLTTFNITRPSTQNRRSECRACTKTKKRRRLGIVPRQPTQPKAPKQPRPASRTRQLMDQLIAEQPDAASLPYHTLKYRARYRFDDEFRAREILRRHLRDY